MSSDSDADEFYDASDTTPHHPGPITKLEGEITSSSIAPQDPQWPLRDHPAALPSLSIGQDLLQCVDKNVALQSQPPNLIQPPPPPQSHLPSLIQQPPTSQPQSLIHPPATSQPQSFIQPPPPATHQPGLMQPPPPPPFLHPLKQLSGGLEFVCVEGSGGGVEQQREECGSVSGLSEGRNRDVEECSSACSGSLLGNLGDDDDDDESIAQRVRMGGRRRQRQQEVRRLIQTEDDDPTMPPPSPPPPQYHHHTGSQSSSTDGIYPAPPCTAHPFRVVEHDTASVYSSISLGKVGKILGGMDALTIQENQHSKDTASKSVESSQSQPSKELIPTASLIHTGLCAGDVGIVTMSPEPDLVASTKSSSGSDKSNSLPRPVQDPSSDLPLRGLPPLQIFSKDAQHLETSSVPLQPLRSQSGEVDVGRVGVRLYHPLPQVIPVAAIIQPPPQPPPPPLPPPMAPPPAVPVAPPRKRRRQRQNTDDDTASVSSLPSPALTISTVDAISIGQCLDLRQAIRGDYLVKPQDSEHAKAVGPSAEELARLEAEDTTSQASTPEVSRAPSRLAAPTSTTTTNTTTTATTTVTTTTTTNQPTSHHHLHHHQPPSTTTSGSPSTPGTPSSIPSDTPSSEVGASPASSNEGQMKQLNLMVRTRSDSGKELSDAEWILQSSVDFDDLMGDEEILQQVTVLNLDTGERIPLSDAENCLPKALNPLSLHIMRITSEYVSNSNVDGPESDEESVVDVTVKKQTDGDSSSVKKKTSQLKKFLGRKMESAVNKARSLAQEVSHHRHREERDIFEDDAPAHDTMHFVKIKTAHSHKGPVEFDNLMYVQEVAGEHTGPIWCMKFSGCGRLLATAGQDHVLRVWVLKQAFTYFLDIRTKCNADIKVSPTPSQESLVSQHSGQSGEDPGCLDPNDDGSAPFMPKPFCVYTGHSADMLDISWSKNYFLLTSSMDKTVRLWHISRKECLCIFQHMDFVTAIAFHPKDDRYFISGALDGKIRLWSIPDKRVVLWNEVGGQPNLITAANFCQNGKFTVVGTYDGRCIFYETDLLKYFTQIYVHSTRRKNAKGRKVTGIEPLPGEDKILITSSDSRIRLYDLRDLNLSCKYKGYSNMSSQIRAGFSHDGKFIVAGSENQCIYIWKTHHDYSKFSRARRDRNVYWEGVKAHSAVVTCAVFAPHPELIFSFIEQQQELLNKSGAQQQHHPLDTHHKQQSQNKDSGTNKGYVLVSADFNGCIKIFLKKEKPKHSSLPASALV